MRTAPLTAACCTSDGNDWYSPLSVSKGAPVLVDFQRHRKSTCTSPGGSPWLGVYEATSRVRMNSRVPTDSCHPGVRGIGRPPYATRGDSGLSSPSSGARSDDEMICGRGVTRSVWVHACASGGVGGGLVRGSSSRGGGTATCFFTVSPCCFVESFGLFVVSFLNLVVSVTVESSVGFAGITSDPGTALTKSSIVTCPRARSTATTGSTDAIWTIVSASPSRVAVLLVMPSAGIAITRGT